MQEGGLLQFNITSLRIFCIISPQYGPYRWLKHVTAYADSIILLNSEVLCLMLFVNM